MNAPRDRGNRYVVAPLSKEYGERRYGVDDLSLQRHSLVRYWRQRGKGRTTIEGVKPPKTGMIWRGTEPEAEELCRALNKASGMGNLSVASDPPIRENAIARAKATARSTRARTSSASSASFARCETCKKIVKQPHGEH